MDVRAVGSGRLPPFEDELRWFLMMGAPEALFQGPVKTVRRGAGAETGCYGLNEGTPRGSESRGAPRYQTSLECVSKTPTKGSSGPISPIVPVGLEDVERRHQYPWDIRLLHHPVDGNGPTLTGLPLLPF